MNLNSRAETLGASCRELCGETEYSRFWQVDMPKRSAPSASELVKIGNVRVPSDWQPFGGFGTYDEYEEVRALCACGKTTLYVHIYSAPARVQCLYAYETCAVLYI